MKNKYEVPETNMVKNPNKGFSLNLYSKEIGKSLNLNLGCGTRILDDYINIDLYNVSEGNKINPDITMDIQQLCNYVEVNTVEKILIVHVLEHFFRWEAVDLLTDFYNCLKVGGILEIEMPDLDGCIDFYINKKGRPFKSPLGNIEDGLAQIYANQWSRNPHEAHKYVWRKKDIELVLTKIGFKIMVINNNPNTHRKGRDMLIIVEK